MDNKKLLGELKAHLLDNTSDKDIDKLIDSLYVEPLSSEHQHLLLNLIKVARAKHLETSEFDLIYKQLLYLFVLTGGRRKALTELARGIHGLSSGLSTLTLIDGKAGIGKTSLAYSVQMLIEKIGAVFVIARCSEQDNGSYSLWRDVVRSIALANDVSINSILAPIGNASPATSLQQLVHNLADWMNEQSSQKSLVILLDDLHWADADSLDVLDILTGRELQSPIMFIATYRSEERHLGHALYDYLPRLQRNRPVSTIHLDPLNIEDVERLISAYLGKCRHNLVQYLHERSEGHPFFTIELLNDLINQNIISQDEDAFWIAPDEASDVPNLLKRLIMQRVERFGSTVSETLVIAATVGEIWSLKIVERLVDFSEEELLEALELALKADIIQVEDDREEIYRFSHGLIKQVLYTSLIARRRKRLHEQIARQIEHFDPDNIYALAHHFYEGESRDKALQYLMQAGEDARQRFANHSALEYLQRALDVLQEQSTHPDYTLQINIFDQIGSVYQVLDQQQNAELMYSRMREIAQSHDSMEWVCRALIKLTYVRISLYQFDLAQQTARDAIHIADEIDNPSLRISANAGLSKILLIRGYLAEHEASQDEILNGDLKIVAPSVLTDSYRGKAYVSMWQGRYDDAAKYAQQCFDTAKISGSQLDITRGYQILSYVQIEMGNYDAAYHNIQKIVDVPESSDTYHHQLPRILNQFGYLYLELGDAEFALKWDKEAFEVSHITIGISSYEIQRYSALNIATDYLHLGQIDDALDYVMRFEQIKEAAEVTRYRYYNRYLLLMSDLQVAREDYGQAIEYAQEARKMASSNSNPKNIAKSHWYEAQSLIALRRIDEAIAHLEKAVSIVDVIKHGSLRWKIRLTLASTLLKAGKSADEIIQKTRQLADATQQNLKNPLLIASFAKSKWLAELELLEQNKIPTKASYPAGLTEREVEVLRLVAAGLTNQQVAESLYISPRTVNTHMTNILNKTNCDNRTVATAFAIRHNLITT